MMRSVGVQTTGWVTEREIVFQSPLNPDSNNGDGDGGDSKEEGWIKEDK